MVPLVLPLHPGQWCAPPILVLPQILGRRLVEHAYEWQCFRSSVHRMETFQHCSPRNYIMCTDSVHGHNVGFLIDLAFGSSHFSSSHFFSNLSLLTRERVCVCLVLSFVKTLSGDCSEGMDKSPDGWLQVFGVETQHHLCAIRQPHNCQANRISGGVGGTESLRQRSKGFRICIGSVGSRGRQRQSSNRSGIEVCEGPGPISQ